MADRPPKAYGRTLSGQEITDTLIEEWAEEAEAGYDADRLKIRGRPLMGSAPAKTFPVRLDPELRSALDQRATEEERPAAEVVRDALRRYLTAG